MRESKVIPLYDQVARKIEHQIDGGRFAPGDRIQSIREICEEFQIADVTAKKALRQLSDRGVVQTVTGSGAFVLDRGQQKEPRLQRGPLVAFIKIGLDAAPMLSHESDLIQHELSNLGYPSLYAVASDDSHFDRLREQVFNSGAECLILFSTHLDKCDELPYLSAFRQANLPLLVVETRSDKDSYVTQDSERTTIALADYLYSIGHRRICLATTIRRKVEGFNAAVAKWNDAGVLHWIIGENGQSNRDTHQLAEQILALSPRPTAVIATDDQAAAIFVSHFVTAGVRVPEELSVVGFGDHPQLAGLSPVPLTVARHPYREIAQEVCAWATLCMSGRPPRRRWRRELTGSLIVRDSTAPPTY